MTSEEAGLSRRSVLTGLAGIATVIGIGATPVLRSREIPAPPEIAAKAAVELPPHNSLIGVV